MNDNPQGVALELLLYLEDRHPSMLATDGVIALTRALADFLAQWSTADSTVDGLCDPVVGALRRFVEQRRREPHAMTPREILDAYRADRARKPWKM